MDSFNKEISRLNRSNAAADRQLEQIQAAEEKYKDDSDSLILFWEKLWAKGGVKFNGVRWTFRIVDLYVKAKRYDDAWRILSDFVHTKPQYITNVRTWQIKILKKEKKDYSGIQQLLDRGE